MWHGRRIAIWCTAKRLGMVAAFTGIALVRSAILGGAADASDTRQHTQTSAPARKAASNRPDTTQNQLTAMRVEMERVHRGKVDGATLQKISAALADLHKGLLAQNTMSPGSDPTARISNLLANTAAQTAQYLAFSDPNGLRTSTVSKRGRPIRVAQNTPPPDQSASPQSADTRTYVGQKTCEMCHQQEASNWAHTIHAKIFNFNPQNPIESEGCEACHGPGSDHVKNPADFTTIISFSHKSKTPIAQQNAQCLSCHKGGQRIFWHDSVHESNNLGCSDCHNPMADFAAHGLTARESINETCFQCHKVQRMEFSERSHMPLLESKLACTDCHNPHGSTTAPLLKADSVNELCYSCHADKRGPFLFEHAPVRENCLNCHAPHGSNFESLLTTPRPLLCQQCHSQDGHPAQLLTSGNLATGAMPDPRLLSTSCQTCHVNIHGSNDPAGARFER